VLHLSWSVGSSCGAITIGTIAALVVHCTTPWLVLLAIITEHQHVLQYEILIAADGLIATAKQKQIGSIAPQRAGNIRAAQLYQEVVGIWHDG